MAWAFGTSSVASIQPNGGSSITINKPTSAADGDLLVAFVLGDAAQTQTGPSGWTQFTNSPKSVASALKVSSWYKVASGEGASWQWTSSGGLYFEGCVGRWTGLLTSGVKDPDGGSTATASTLNAPTVTTTGSDDMCVRFAGSWNATTLSFASGSSRISSGSNGDLLRVYDQDITSPSATGTDLATADASNQMVTYTGTFIQTAATAQDTPELYGRPMGVSGQRQMQQLLTI